MISVNPWSHTKIKRDRYMYENTFSQDRSPIFEDSKARRNSHIWNGNSNSFVHKGICQILYTICRFISQNNCPQDNLTFGSGCNQLFDGLQVDKTIDQNLSRRQNFEQNSKEKFAHLWAYPGRIRLYYAVEHTSVGWRYSMKIALPPQTTKTVMGYRYACLLWWW
jgi:hypothetical protein